MDFNVINLKFQQGVQSAGMSVNLGSSSLFSESTNSRRACPNCHETGKYAQAVVSVALHDDLSGAPRRPLIQQNHTFHTMPPPFPTPIPNSLSTMYRRIFQTAPEIFAALHARTYHLPAMPHRRAEALATSLRHLLSHDVAVRMLQLHRRQGVQQPCHHPSGRNGGCREHGGEQQGVPHAANFPTTSR